MKRRFLDTFTASEPVPACFEPSRGGRDPGSVRAEWRRGGTVKACAVFAVLAVFLLLPHPVLARAHAAAAAAAAAAEAERVAEAAEAERAAAEQAAMNEAEAQSGAAAEAQSGAAEAQAQSGAAAAQPQAQEAKQRVIAQSAATNPVGRAIVTIIAFVAETFLFFAGQLLLILIDALIFVAQYNEFITAPAIANGWIIVRDIANMAVVVVLLVLAFGTMVGSSKYNIKNRALVQLLLMAVIINFSRTICGILIDASQVVMLTFVAGFKEAAGGNFVEALQLNKLMALKASGDIASSSIAISMILAVVMTVISIGVVIIMLSVLVFRIITLWLLVVMSPLAFLLRAVPGGAAGGYYGQWWSMFTGQLVVGPLLAFFLWLSLITVATGGTTDGFKMDQGAVESASNAASAAFDLTAILPFFISICLLMAGVMFAQKLSGQAVGVGKKIANRLGKTAVGASKAIAGGFAGRTGITSAYNRTKEGVLGLGTRIPLVGSMAGRALGKHRVEIASKGAEANKWLSGLTPAERARLKPSGPDALLGPEARGLKKQVLISELKEAGKKGVKTPKEKAEYLKKKKELAALGERLKDPSVKEELVTMEKEHPELILDRSEKDEKERKRQAEALRKNARGKTGRQIGEMTAGNLSDEFLMSVDPKALLDAGRESGADVKERIAEFLGKSVEELEGLDVRDKEKVSDMTRDVKQWQNDVKKDNLDIVESSERQKLMKDMSGEDIVAGATKAKAEGRPEGFNEIVSDAVDAGRAASVAAAMTDEDIKKLPEELAKKLRKALKDSDLTKALASGGALKDNYKSYDPSKGVFTDPKEREKLGEVTRDMDEPHILAGAMGSEVLGKNGGLNDVTITLLSQLNEDDIGKMAAEGKTGQVDALLKAMEKIAGADAAEINVFQNSAAKSLPAGMGEAERVEAMRKLSSLIESARINAKDLANAAKTGPLKGQIQEMRWRKPK